MACTAPSMTVEADDVVTTSRANSAIEETPFLRDRRHRHSFHSSRRNISIDYDAEAIFFRVSLYVLIMFRGRICGFDLFANELVCQ